MSNEDDFDSFLAGFNLDELENPDSVAAAATTTPSTPLQKNLPPTSSDSPPQVQYLRPSQFHKKTPIQVPRHQQQQQRLQQTLPPPQHKQQVSVTPQKRSPPRDMPSPFAAYLDDTNDPLPQYDQDAAKTWVYPVKYEKRQYQYDIVRSALFNNTLVCLPTGLGKTFIAAAVILNYYRWFPNGKVVFIAPTKPLVSQQIKAVHDCTGIPKEDQCEMTGSIKPSDRVGLWGEKRVFYVTSDIISNDISAGTCPAGAIRLIIFDEAHRAQGNHSYVQAVESVSRMTRHFRIVALSASPGASLEVVQKLVENLHISKIEMRTDNDPDVARYLHSRREELITVAPDDNLTRVQNAFENVMRAPIKKLGDNKIIKIPCIRRFSSFTLLRMINGYVERTKTNPNSVNTEVLSDMYILVSLYKMYETLINFGVRPFYSAVTKFYDGKKSSPDAKPLFNGPYWKEAMSETRAVILSLPKTTGSHPKIGKLKEIIYSHFQSLSEIVMCLSDVPGVKPIPFVGQSKGKDGNGLRQKDQIALLDRFRGGEVNVLVATSIGEEGLDIGEVDLVVCYDVQASFIKSTQRTGRTGRKRDGRVVTLAMEGTETNNYHKSAEKSGAIISKILRNNKLRLSPFSSRMLPNDIIPTPLEVSDPEHFFRKKVPLSSMTPKRMAQTLSDIPAVPEIVEKHEIRPTKRTRKTEEEEEEIAVPDSPCLETDNIELAEHDTKPFAITPEILSNFSPKSARTYKIGYSAITKIAIRSMRRIQEETESVPMLPVRRKVPGTPRKRQKIDEERKNTTEYLDIDIKESTVSKVEALKTPERERGPLTEIKMTTDKNNIGNSYNVDRHQKSPSKKCEETKHPDKSLKSPSKNHEDFKSSDKSLKSPSKNHEDFKSPAKCLKSPSKKREETTCVSSPAKAINSITAEDALDDFVTLSGRDYKHFFDFDKILSGTKSTSTPFVVPPPPTRANFFKEEQKQKQEKEEKKDETCNNPEQSQKIKRPVPQVAKEDEVISLVSSPSQGNSYENNEAIFDGIDMDELFGDDDDDEEAIEDNTVYMNIESSDEDDTRERPKTLRKLTKCGNDRRKVKKGLSLFLDSEAEESDCDDEDDDEDNGRRKKSGADQPFRNGEDDDDFEDDMLSDEDDDDAVNSLDSFICDDIEYMSSESQELDPDEPSEPSNRNSKSESSFYQKSLCTPRKSDNKFSTPNKFGGDGKYKFRGNALSKTFDEVEREMSREVPTALVSKTVAELLKRSPGSNDGICFVECPFDFECDVTFGSGLNSNGIIVVRGGMLPLLERMDENFYDLKCKLSLFAGKYTGFSLIFECDESGGNCRYPRAASGLQTGLCGIKFLKSASGRQTVDYIRSIIMKEWGGRKSDDGWLSNDMTPQTLMRLKDDVLKVASDIPQLNFLSAVMVVDYFKSVKQIRKQKDPTEIEKNAQISSFAAMLVFKKYHE